MKSVFKIIGTLIIIYIVVLTCNTVISNEMDKDLKENLLPYFEKQNAIDDVIKTTKIISQKLPIENEDGLILYKIEYVENESAQKFYYTFPNVAVKDLDKEEMNNYKKAWKAILTEVANNNPNNKDYVTAKVDFIYMLEDENGDRIFDFTIKSTEYK